MFLPGLVKLSGGHVAAVGIHGGRFIFMFSLVGLFGFVEAECVVGVEEFVVYAKGLWHRAIQKVQILIVGFQFEGDEVVEIV